VALAMTLLIAAFFGLGAWELRGFRRASGELAAAVGATPAEAAAWLATLPATLRGAVQQRLEGQRVALPGLALAPALAGLLVLLGMLGTFIGLVMTLGGTAQAVNATADLTALRAALGAPVQGLGLAFSASVAGVTASATLGLMVALARRERAAAAQALDTALLGPLLPLTAGHRRALAQAAAEQAGAERAAATQQALLAEFRQFTQQIGDTVATRLREHLGNEQASFHGEAQAAYQALAASVDTTLRAALTDSARLAGEAIRPAAEATLAGIAREAAALHEGVGRQVGELVAAQATQMAGQLDTLRQHFEAGARDIATQARAAQAAETGAAAAQREALLQLLADSATRSQQAADALAARLSSQTDALLATLTEAHARQQAAQAEADAQRRAELRADLAALAQERQAAQALLAAGSENARQTMAGLSAQFTAQTQALIAMLTEAQQGLQAAHADGDAARLAAWREALQGAGAQQLAQQQQMADGLLGHTRALVAQAEAQARTTLSEAGALLKAAGEAPRAAVEVVAAMREQLSQGLAQDQATLAERAELMQTLATLLAALQQAAGEQRAAIDALVQHSATRLEATAERFTAQADATGHTLAEAATSLAVSAAELGSLGEGFGEAVAQFQGANAQLVQHLGALEERLSGAMTRSDEQLGYYVAQAREVIDLCLGSQKQALDALQASAGAPHG
jgi:hypothetical protein